ncbi:MAG: hypothetical protein A3H61_04725 [Candidatus Jacksonbacteria bacterium RIFCSPLOWO2_02_FULL_44_20]|uniref:HicB-like antitoxin of toxin-antitoxin system domain-containing protein n=1 Tax=Candidatus Jacksonbacteria bacterium RIFCSPLOWO2_02_FULL_44_20 TaxID=1798460 RepID=A0A1G2AAF5_9BACT|nr:MAG: hypothetical protein A3C00_02185 [Candidatus Jacksonbacteria bacterium RIFCSPHIGHO2_02_FULL_44_25]OGY71987.1 MAG: hypothetical protein A3E05_01980 [Candidatus Jacksonbacteria bacterium RIFCSPHIGHO2_12_FULL_44_12]OGY73486.1 MAG: hypothetical protein A3H61_04725 [Candidatus Jacksonbacteria bacterium RIFCSPLOWO2_02_FULL_44_20]OGY74450.1 MAG: hypothetical protein A3H07_00440 [Candidatus Jacksonbacteria bacterium RIFCSPLOWO2_12_FULL_44_15b]
MNLPITINHYTVILEPADEGGYTVTVPALPGCSTEGETFEEAIAMARDAIEGYLESLIKHGEPIPVENGHLITTSLEIKLPQWEKTILQPV